MCGSSPLVVNMDAWTAPEFTQRALLGAWAVVGPQLAGLVGGHVEG